VTLLKHKAKWIADPDYGLKEAQQGRTIQIRSEVAEPCEPSGPYALPPTAPKIESDELRRLIQVAAVLGNIQGLEPTDLAYFEGRGRAMACYYPGYVSRSPDELLKTSYSGLIAAVSRIHAAAASVSASSTEPPRVSGASRAADPVSGASRAADPGSRASCAAAQAGAIRGSGGGPSIRPKHSSTLPLASPRRPH
jgi:hypothetical protein